MKKPPDTGGVLSVRTSASLHATRAVKGSHTFSFFTVRKFLSTNFIGVRCTVFNEIHIKNTKDNLEKTPR